MRPYLEKLQDVWPWLLLAGLCGGVVTASTAAAVVAVTRRYSASPWLHVGRWKDIFTSAESQPLIPRREKGETKLKNYVTTM